LLTDERSIIYFTCVAQLVLTTIFDVCEDSFRSKSNQQEQSMYRIEHAVGIYRVLDEAAPQDAGSGWRTYFMGSFADCWAWIQYQEYVK
jgi:hypothetical protein